MSILEVIRRTRQRKYAFLMDRYRVYKSLRHQVENFYIWYKNIHRKKGVIKPPSLLGNCDSFCNGWACALDAHGGNAYRINVSTC